MQQVVHSFSASVAYLSKTSVLCLYAYMYISSGENYLKLPVNFELFGGFSGHLSSIDSEYISVGTTFCATIKCLYHSTSKIILLTISTD